MDRRHATLAGHRLEELRGIVQPARPLIDSDVEQVVAPGSEGEFGVLPGHAPVLVELKPGVVRWIESGRNRRAAITGGFAEVTLERVTVLAPIAELAELNDGRTLPSLRRISDAPRTGCGFLGLSDCYGCVRGDLKDAISQLGAKDKGK